MLSQKDIFMQSEGNAWFARNQNSSSDSFDVRVIRHHISTLHGRALEIGCASGHKLNSYASNFEAYGIDPSLEAIKTGTQLYPQLNLSIGTSDFLNYPNSFFDVVVVGFCLYLVDRELIFKTVSEIDRVLKDNGLLIITDFDSPVPLRNPYHHYQGIYSYKQHYENLFLASPTYSLVEKKSYSHHGTEFVTDINERVSTVVLKKNIGNGYVHR